MIYSINGNRLSNAYDKGGQIVSPYNKDGERIGHEITSKYTRSLMFTLDLPTGTQGIACDSITQTIAQLYTGNIYLINVSDGSYSHIASSFNLGHGHTGQFAPTKTAEQEYPYLYVSGPNLTVENNKYTCLLMVGCTSNSATMKKIYAIPADATLTGTCQVCIDFENEVIYHVAASTYYGTADYTYISAWDMTDIELLEGASYSPSPQEGIYALKTKLFEFQIPFVPEMQACTFYDGLIGMLSDVTGNKYYEFVDVDLREVYMTMTTQIASSEMEGIGFLLNEGTGKHDLVVSDRSMSFYRYQFE